MEIIGFIVDANELSISMSPESKQKLIDSLRDFVLNTPDNKRQQSLRSWLRMLGYANWALNVFPLLKPALNSSYDKTAGKSIMNQSIYINKQVRNDLLWFADSVEHLDGVQVLEAEHWSVEEADL